MCILPVTRTSSKKSRPSKVNTVVRKSSARTTHCSLYSNPVRQVSRKWINFIKTKRRVTRLQMKANNKVTNFSISKLLLNAILAFFDFVAPCWKLICVKERVFVEENGTKTELSLKVIPFCCRALFGGTSFDFLLLNFLEVSLRKNVQYYSWSIFRWD